MQSPTLLLLIFVIKEIQSTTYYFNINQTTNEYRVSNRQIPQSIQSSGQLAELRNNVSRGIIIKSGENQTHPLLDSDWDYNWKNITRPKLPAYIYKIYDTFTREENNTDQINILFNNLANISNTFRFNLSNLILLDDFTDIELHFYLFIGKKRYQKPIILRLYQLDNGISNTNPDSHKLLNVIYVSQAENGWQMFKLTNSLPKALKNDTTLELFITVSKPNDEKYEVFKDTKNETLQTFLIWKSGSFKQNLTTNDVSTNRDSSCLKRDLQINFKKLNWMKFIIAPQGYNAFQCSGRCYKNSILPNYIKVASFHPEINRKLLCCNPTSYEPLPIMFYERNGNIALKYYENMIVSDCGCQ